MNDPKNVPAAPAAQIILDLVSIELDELYGLRTEAEETNIIHSIPPDERATTYKSRKIDCADKNIDYYNGKIGTNRRRVYDAASELLARNGFKTDGRPRKR